FLREDQVGVSEQLFFPGGQQLFTELMLTTNLSSGLRPGQNLEDDAGLEFGFESTMFLHLWIPLSGLYAVDQKLSSFWGPLQPEGKAAFEAKDALGLQIYTEGHEPLEQVGPIWLEDFTNQCPELEIMLDVAGVPWWVLERVFGWPPSEHQ